MTNNVVAFAVAVVVVKCTVVVTVSLVVRKKRINLPPLTNNFPEKKHLLTLQKF